MEIVFTGNLQSAECGDILIKCLRNVEQKMNEIIALVKAIPESQIMGKLQESVEFISAISNEYEKDKKQKEAKIKTLEDNNLKLYDKIAIFRETN